MTDNITAAARESNHEYTTWDAPYVLGSLTRSERREYEDHLASCPDCKAAVAELAGLPGMLALVDTDTALAMIEPADPATAPGDPPVPELLPRLADAAERRRRRSRWLAVGGAVAAAAAAVAIAIPVVAAVTGSPAPSSEQIVAERSMQPLQPTPVSASFKLIRADDKTRVVMTCSYGAGEQKYQWNLRLVVHTDDGGQLELDQWPAGPGTELTIDTKIDKTPDQIRAVEIRSVATNQTILTGTV